LQQKLEAGQLREAQSDTSAMMEIVGSLLRITELEEDGRTRILPVINFPDVVIEVVDAYRPIFEESGRKLVTNNASGAQVRGDWQLLSQLLSNLLENVLHHTPEGSSAEIAVQSTEAGCAVSVTDNGPGVPEQEIENIFARFHRLQTSRVTKGHGLGLSLVKAIANYHRATCEAQNLRPGLRIEVKFPVVS
jgi:signal transduction histidine kinase